MIRNLNHMYPLHDTSDVRTNIYSVFVTYSRLNQCESDISPKGTGILNSGFNKQNRGTCFFNLLSWVRGWS